MNEHVLRVVDANGELAETEYSYDQLLLIKERLEAEKNGDRLQIANLKREIRDLQGVEPQAEDVKTVLGYWSRRVVEEGWWTRAPTFKPGSERWSCVRARLKDEWTAGELCEVVEGALFSLAQRRQRGQQTPRAWADATSIFRNERNCSLNFEAAKDPRLERVRQMRELPAELQRLIAKEGVGRLLEVCDCGCSRLAHSRPDPEFLGQRACLVCGWEVCPNFSDTFRRVEAWKRERRAA